MHRLMYNCKWENINSPNFFNFSSGYYVSMLFGSRKQLLKHVMMRPGYCGRFTRPCGASGIYAITRLHLAEFSPGQAGPVLPEAARAGMPPGYFLRKK